MTPQHSNNKCAYGEMASPHSNTTITHCERSTVRAQLLHTPPQDRLHRFSGLKSPEVSSGVGGSDAGKGVVKRANGGEKVITRARRRQRASLMGFLLIFDIFVVCVAEGPIILKIAREKTGRRANSALVRTRTRHLRPSERCWSRGRDRTCGCRTS